MPFKLKGFEPDSLYAGEHQIERVYLGNVNLYVRDQFATQRLARGRFTYAGFDIDSTIEFGFGSYSVEVHRIDFQADLSVALPSGTFDLIGFDVDVDIDLKLHPEIGVYVYTGFDIGVTQNHSFEAETGTFTLIGYPIEFMADDSNPTPSYWNDGGRGDRTTMFNITTTAVLGGGNTSNLIDAAYADNGTDSLWFAGGQSGREIKFQSLAGPKIIDGFRWFQNSGLSNHGTWVFEGSNDDSSYTPIGSSFTLPVNQFVAVYEFVNTTAYTYHRLRQTAGVTNGTPWIREIEFRIAGDGIPNRDPIESGNRTSIISVSTTCTMQASTNIQNLIDGDYAESSTGSAAFTTGESLREIKFDLGLGVAKAITGFSWLQHAITTHGTWTFEGSNDDVSYTPLVTGVNLGGSIVTDSSFINTTAYRYYKLRQTAGTMHGSPWVKEIEFKVW